ncbi:hypothetical protein FRB95_008976 [Tulasnella sp. JGI-2019a]|nr:hypothetical protein FRB95_008976 [Tulasnella sp. JGI-2019a]
MSNLAQSCRLLGSTAQGHLLVQHVLPLLDTLDLSEEARSKFLEGVGLVKARWQKYPQFDYQQRKVEIADLMMRLGRNIRLKSAEDGLPEENEILVELVQAILEWSKQLWIVGAEFGEEGEFVHESLSFLYHSLMGFGSSAAVTCTCVVPSIDVKHAFLQSDGQLVNEFRGRSNCVVRAVLLQVWRDMILANLVKPENESDTSHFARKLLPSFFKDIMEMNRKRASILFKILDPHSGHRRPDGRCGHRNDVDEEDDDDEYDEDEDEGDEYDEDEDEDEETDDDMPPLIDVTKSYADKTEDSGDDMPPLLSVSDSGSDASNMACRKRKARIESESESEDKNKNDAEPRHGSDDEGEEWIDTDSSESEAGIREVPPLTRELDKEEEMRTAAQPRLKRLIYAHVIENVKQNPSVIDFNLIISLRPALKSELIQHYINMPHNSVTFEGVVNILVSTNSSVALIKVLEANRDVARRCPRAMQEAILHLSMLSQYRVLATSLLKSEIHAITAAMVVEIECSFEGLRKPEKKKEAQEFHKIPASERPERAKAWLHEVITRSPESLSNDAQANVGADPVDLFAAITATLGLGPQGGPISTFSTPLYADPIEALGDNPAEVDPELLERFRPSYAKTWNAWIITLSDATRRNPTSFIPIAAALTKDILVMAPYLAQHSLVTEMKLHCGTVATKHIKDILTALHSFIVEQRRYQATARKAKEKKTAAAAARATEPAPNGSTPTPIPPASTPTPVPPPPTQFPGILYNILGFTVPAEFLSNDNAPPSPAPWDDVD